MVASKQLANCPGGAECLNWLTACGTCIRNPYRCGHPVTADNLKTAFLSQEQTTERQKK